MGARDIVRYVFKLRYSLDIVDGKCRVCGRRVLSGRVVGVEVGVERRGWVRRRRFEVAEILGET